MIKKQIFIQHQDSFMIVIWRFMIYITVYSALYVFLKSSLYIFAGQVNHYPHF